MKRLLRRAEWKENGIRVLAPVLIPKAESWWARWLNRRLFALYVWREREWLGKGCREYWCFVPNAVDLIPPRDNHETHEIHERGRKVIYYCVDDWTQFSNIDGVWMGGKERLLLARADVVFAASKFLVEKCEKERGRGDVVYMPHGVEYAKFAQASNHLSSLIFTDNESSMDQGQSTKDQGQRTTIGFYGNISDWVDLRLVEELAVRCPDWDFVLIGPVTGDVGCLPGCRNIRYPGRIEHDALPGWCWGFDAGMIPYRLDYARMASVNPVKAKELLAAGVPIVASDVPELRGREPDIVIAAGVEDWVAKLGMQARRSDRTEISRKMKNEDWEHKIRIIRERLTTKHTKHTKGGGGGRGG